jgi:hypothetical protein
VRHRRHLFAKHIRHRRHHLGLVTVTWPATWPTVAATWPTVAATWPTVTTAPWPTVATATL